MAYSRFREHINSLMNQAKVKLLRKLFRPPFGENDPRNRVHWQDLKRRYKKLPWNARFPFLVNLDLLNNTARQEEVAQGS